MGIKASSLALETLLELPNVEKVEVYYRWNLIKDSDDNKFTDCALAAGAQYLVSNDKDFNILKMIPFPKISLLTIDEFEKMMNKR